MFQQQDYVWTLVVFLYPNGYMIIFKDLIKSDYKDSLDIHFRMAEVNWNLFLLFRLYPLQNSVILLTA